MKAIELPRDVVYAGPEICGELAMAESREILLTNGIGGYSSMTIASSLTRSYHGLLIAALRPPLDRTLLLTKLNETVMYNDRSYHLATDRRKEYAVRKQFNKGNVNGCLPIPLNHNGFVAVRAGASLDTSGTLDPVWNSEAASLETSALHHGEVICPAGFELLQSFRLEGTVPIFSYAFADALLEKKIWMKRGQNTVYVTYYLRRAGKAIQMRIKALVNHRNHHTRTSAQNPHFNYSSNVAANGSAVSVLFTTPDQQQTKLCMKVSSGKAQLTNEWIAGFVLNEERSRGLHDMDDHLHAATFVLELVPGGQVTFVATAEPNNSRVSTDGEHELAMQHAYEKALLSKFVVAREKNVLRKMQSEDDRHGFDNLSSYTQGIFPASRPTFCNNIEPCIMQLVLAADQFIISRASGRSIVAGFHWFTDWARDTMISLPGLTIATGRYDVARSILQTFAKYVSKGMLPNRFPDDGSAPTEEDYNSADGTLWYFEAIRTYYMATGDVELLIELYPTLQGIVAHHCLGTRHGIRQDVDGLLQAGSKGLALTWMDAKADIVYTPRAGKPVEVAALWFNALHSMAFFASELEHEEECDHFTAMANKTERSFQEKLWNAETSYCYDVIDGGTSKKEKDASLRPNQLIAAALNWSPLTAEQRFMVVEACSSHLLTSNAIRTLSPDDEKYCGVYVGNVFSRDMAYHQGTGWTWLLGPFVLAHLRVFKNQHTAREFILPLLRSHLNDAGMGQISEIFDGDPPNRARGCIAQAWSVAELLRAWLLTEPAELYSNDL